MIMSKAAAREAVAHGWLPKEAPIRDWRAGHLRIAGALAAWFHRAVKVATLRRVAGLQQCALLRVCVPPRRFCRRRHTAILV